MTDKQRISTYVTKEEEMHLRIAAALNRTSISKYLEWLIIKDMEEIKQNPKGRNIGLINKELYEEYTKEKSFDD